MEKPKNNIREIPSPPGNEGKTKDVRSTQNKAHGAKRNEQKPSRRRKIKGPEKGPYNDQELPF